MNKKNKRSYLACKLSNGGGGFILQYEKFEGKLLMKQPLPVLFLFVFWLSLFLAWISSHTPVSLFKPESVHSGSVSSDDCSQASSDQGNLVKRLLSATVTVEMDLHIRLTSPSDAPMGELRMKSVGAMTSTRETASSFSSPHRRRIASRMMRGAPLPVIYPPATTTTKNGGQMQKNPKCLLTRTSAKVLH